MPETRILMGVVGRPHGVRGLVRVVSYATDPASLAAYGPLSDERGRRFALRWRGEGIAELSEHAGGRVVPVADRDAAAQLTNTRLYLDRAQLPPPDPDEFYLADLVGLRADAPTGETLGEVVAVHDYGAGASLEIARSAASPLLVPFTRACVPELDPASGRLTVVLPHEITVEPAAQEASA
jgi:16S rRNA processing protein RimM